MSLTPEQFYNLTYRQFTNYVNGYQKEKDLESRERWSLTRKIMWATLLPNMKRGFKETDILAFPWEEKIQKQLTLEDHQKLLAEAEKVKEFYRVLDAKENKA